MPKRSFNAASVTPDELGAQLYAEAARKNPDLRRMKTLIAAGANIEYRGDQNYTPLLAAVGKQNVDAAALLIDNGADKYVRAGEMAPMFYAIALYHLDMVKMLLDKGVDPERDVYKGGLTALMWAANFGKKNLADELARRGGDVNRINPNDGKAAPDYAEDNLKPHIAKSLRRIDTEKKDLAIQEERAEKDRAEQQRLAAEKAALDAECDAGLPLKGSVKVMRPLSLARPAAKI
ncbi:MAG: ankyrin repeat domain-containing protein [Alphaproteobacteria bacterium]|nr:MAG: ankyrin repeat domain-containing protein [Alphaproteobacteria bacterium]